MHVSYDASLIFLSILVACVGSYAALGQARAMRESAGRTATWWMLAGGSTLGMAIWGMHFTGMLAMRLPLEVGYDPALTLFSVVPAILAATLGFYVVRAPLLSEQRFLLGGALIGLGVSAMHYIGMAALTLDPPLAYDPLIVLLSVLIGILASWGALILMYRRWKPVVAPWLPQLVSAVMMGLGICAMHYTAMIGLHIPAGAVSLSSTSGLAPNVLAGILGSAALVWFGGGILATLFDRRMTRQNAEALAQLRVEHETLLRQAQDEHMAMIGALRESEERTRMLMEHAPDAVVIVRPEGGILYANLEAERVLGASSAELRDKDFFAMTPPHLQAIYRQNAQQLIRQRGRMVGPMRLNLSGNAKAYYETSAIALPDDSIYLALRDISERQQMQAQLESLAYYDPLTNLPNRRLLIDHLQLALAAVARSGNHGALLLLDLDNFKMLNDSHGHELGDQLLCEAARRMKECVRGQDVVARFGGDEFIVLLGDLSADESMASAQAGTVAEKIRASLARPYALRRGEGEEPVVHHCSSSIGVLLFGGAGQEPDHLLRRADVAMYQAKAAGRNSIRFFDPAMQSAIEARSRLEAEMHVALERMQFFLHYQMQVDDRGRTVGAEVLLRWNHPGRGMVSPAEFIPLAEASGLILPLGAWVLESACAQIACWQKQPPFSHLVLAVNVSARQFRQGDFVNQVIAAVRRHEIPPSRLKLELTESLVLEDVEDTIAKMRVLRAFGVGFAMDDFGTGYSSLAYLKRLPLDQIKIDQSFVRDIGSAHSDLLMVQTMIGLGSNFGLEVVAEGVETDIQHEQLRRAGCGLFQGYLFSRPLSLEAFEARVAATERAA